MEFSQLLNSVYNFNIYYLKFIGAWKYKIESDGLLLTILYNFHRFFSYFLLFQFQFL